MLKPTEHISSLIAVVVVVVGVVVHVRGPG